MSDCSKHKREIAGITDMKILGEMIGDLHYEALAELFHHLEDKLWKDGNKDFDAGRTKLGDNLIDASFGVQQAHYHIDRAWEISKPFMDK
jgi:hypothetical protein